MKNSVLMIAVALTWGCSSAAPTQVQPNTTASASGESCAHEEGSACAHHGEGHECGHGGHEVPGNAGGARASADGTQHFGAPLNGALAVTPLATILASPQTYAGQTVRTEGEVSAVCQRMGCWMELRAENGSVRVPIAGHAFFLPRDITGRRAIIEGNVAISELSEAQRAHLASEGAQTLGAGVAITATGVQLQP